MIQRSEIRRAAYLARARSGLLSKDCKVLIIGDRPGPRASADPDFHDIPFYGDKFSGGYLNRALNDAGIDESKLMWMNAYSQSGVPSSPGILADRCWEHVIVLGNNAENWIKMQGYSNYTRFVHPQSHRRFNSKEVYPLITFLKTILN